MKNAVITFSREGTKRFRESTAKGEEYGLMMENVIAAILSLVAVIATIWCWWYENHGTDLK
ncbi:MAG: hypothetical protein ACI4AA_10705 [Lachnospiraceae bacterium]